MRHAEPVLSSYAHLTAMDIMNFLQGIVGAKHLESHGPGLAVLGCPGFWIMIRKATFSRASSISPTFANDIVDIISFTSLNHSTQWASLAPDTDGQTEAYKGSVTCSRSHS